jgi:hypothetical protein
MLTTTFLVALLSTGNTIKFKYADADGRQYTVFSNRYNTETKELFDIIQQKTVVIDLNNTAVLCFKESADNFKLELEQIAEFFNRLPLDIIGKEAAQFIYDNVNIYSPIIKRCILLDYYDIRAVEKQTESFLIYAKERWKLLIHERKKEIESMLQKDRGEFLAASNADGVAEIDSILTAIKNEVLQSDKRIEQVTSYKELVQCWPPVLYPKPEYA